MERSTRSSVPPAGEDGAGAGAGDAGYRAHRAANARPARPLARGAKLRSDAVAAGNRAAALAANSAEGERAREREMFLGAGDAPEAPGAQAAQLSEAARRARRRESARRAGRKALATFMAVVLAIGLTPLPAFAADGGLRGVSFNGNVVAASQQTTTTVDADGNVSSETTQTVVDDEGNVESQTTAGDGAGKVTIGGREVDELDGTASAYGSYFLSRASSLKSDGNIQSLHGHGQSEGNALSLQDGIDAAKGSQADDASDEAAQSGDEATEGDGPAGESAKGATDDADVEGASEADAEDPYAAEDAAIDVSKVEGDFSAQRIVVALNDGASLQPRDENNVVSEGAGLYVLGYKNRDAAKRAYVRYTNYEGAAFVAPDAAVEAAAGEDGDDEGDADDDSDSDSRSTAAGNSASNGQGSSSSNASINAAAENPAGGNDASSSSSNAGEDSDDPGSGDADATEAETDAPVADLGTLEGDRLALEAGASEREAAEAGASVDERTVTVALIDTAVAADAAEKYGVEIERVSALGAAQPGAAGTDTHGDKMLAALMGAYGAAGKPAGARIVAIEALDGSGRGSAASVYAALSLAAAARADVVSMSFAGYDVAGNEAIGAGVEEARRAASGEGRAVALLAAAGNMNQDVRRFVPASCEGVQAVGALDAAKAPFDASRLAAGKAASSNYGEGLVWAVGETTSYAAAAAAGTLSAMGAQALAGDWARPLQAALLERAAAPGDGEDPGETAEQDGSGEAPLAEAGERDGVEPEEPGVRAAANYGVDLNICLPNFDQPWQTGTAGRVTFQVGSNTPVTAQSNENGEWSSIPEGTVIKLWDFTPGAGLVVDGAPKYGSGTNEQVYSSGTALSGAGTASNPWKLTVQAGGVLCIFTKGLTYRATLNANGGTGGTSSVAATYYSAMPEAEMPTREGYTLLGYYDTDASSGGTQYYNGSGASARLWDKAEATTLYARWRLNVAGEWSWGAGTSGTYVTYDSGKQTASISYNSYVQPVKLPAGRYLIEAWGADGGKATNGNRTGAAGAGGYSKGTVELDGGGTVYACLGQAGPSVLNYTGASLGGFNGGGAATGNGGSTASGGGGGATHVATSAGELAGFEEDPSGVLLVAGGGGGGGAYTNSGGGYGNGGAGGGQVGGDGTYTHSYSGGKGLGGAQSAAVTKTYFGRGANYWESTSTSYQDTPGGGGGWYGGQAGKAYGGAAGGGSGHLGGATAANTFSGTSTSGLFSLGGKTYTISGLTAQPNGTGFSSRPAAAGSDGYVVITRLCAKVALDDQAATTSGTAAVYYQDSDKSFYGDISCKQRLVSISVPAKEGYTFGGYFAKAGGLGAKCVEASGSIASTFGSAVEPGMTAYAYWYHEWGADDPSTLRFDKASQTLDVEYSGASEALTLSRGLWQLEAWGGSGGAGTISDTYTSPGGTGGYSKGVFRIGAETPTVNVTVGGAGRSAINASGNSSRAGGYNGGGLGRNNDSGTTQLGSGGGATHFAATNGVLSSFASDASGVILVAGGGGGGGTYYNRLTGWSYGAAGAGGGEAGGAGTDTAHRSGYTPTLGGGGGQTSCGVGGSRGGFGYGGSTNDEVTGGGGGWWGGNAGGYNGGSAGGGSGHLGGAADPRVATNVFSGTSTSGVFQLGGSEYTIKGLTTGPDGDGWVESPLGADPATNGYARVKRLAIDLTFDNAGARTTVFVTPAGSAFTDTDLTNGFNLKPIRSGYEFGGWYSGANGAGTQYVTAEGAVSDEAKYSTTTLTCYAYWYKAITYNVKGSSAKDVFLSDEKLALSEADAFALAGSSALTGAADGKTFVGWASTSAKAAAGTVDYAPGAAVTTTGLTLYPVYKSATAIAADYTLPASGGARLADGRVSYSVPYRMWP